MCIQNLLIAPGLKCIKPKRVCSLAQEIVVVGCMSTGRDADKLRNEGRAAGTDP